MLAVSLVSAVSPAAVRLANPTQPCMQVARRPAAHVTVTYAPHRHLLPPRRRLCCELRQHGTKTWERDRGRGWLRRPRVNLRSWTPESRAGGQRVALTPPALVPRSPRLRGQPCGVSPGPMPNTPRSPPAGRLCASALFLQGSPLHEDREGSHGLSVAPAAWGRCGDITKTPATRSRCNTRFTFYAESLWIFTKTRNWKTKFLS